MSIVFTIYNESGELYPFTETPQPVILIDEDERTIKEKLFAFEGRKLFVNFTRIRRDVTNADPKLFVSSILDLYEQEHQDYEDVYKSTKTNDDSLNALVREYREEGFKDLTLEDMRFAVHLAVYNQMPQTFDTSELERYITEVDKKEEQMMEKYNFITNPDSLIGRFYKELRQETSKATIQTFYTNIIYEISKGSIQIGSTGKFIRLEAIFNAYPLSETTPMIAIGGGSANPMIKVHNNLLRNVNEREFRSWILSERKKSNIVAFKKVKGLLIKVWNGDNMDYLTFHLSENGEIVARFSSREGEANETGIRNDILRKVEEIVGKINEMEGVYTKSKKIDPLDSLTVNMSSVSAKVDVNMYIDRDALRDACYDNDVKKIFSVKQTKSEDVLSLYYKPRNNFSSDDSNILSVAISDHKVNENSSTITVYNVDNLEYINAIVLQIEALAKISGGSGERKSKVRGLSEIKELRKAGADIQSTKCQKPRQPIISDTETPHPKSYFVKLNGKRFVCPKKEYPFPGFTNENIVCCFQKDQRGRDAFVRNMNTAEAEIMVQPSNLLVEVTGDNDKSSFKTYVIKVVSEYVEGFDENNSMSRYYYVSDSNTLVPLTNIKLIEEIEELNNDEEKEIWLDIVPFTRIINDPPKNKCNYPPNLLGKKDNDVNSPCSHHSKNKIFGYNLHSYPCCFDKERDVFTTKKKTAFDITKQHIYKTDKTLDFQRVGILPPPLHKLFNKSSIFKSDNINSGEYYRVGVVQNVSAFLNAVLLSSNNMIAGVNVSNSFELKKMIIDRLSKNPDEFRTLNNGLLMEKYWSLANFSSQLLDNSVKVYWQDVIDIVQRLTGVNIYILDVPYKTTELTRTLDYTNMKLLCQTFGFSGKENRKENIVLLKKDWSYEVIVYIGAASKDRSVDRKVVYTFPNSHPVIQFMDKYYSSTCIKEDIYPKGFSYDPLLSFEHVSSILSKTPYKITHQVVGGNKVYYALSKSNMYIPVKERGIIDGIGKEDVGASKQTLSEFKTDLVALKKYGIDMSIRGLSVVDGQVNAVLTNFGQFVPLRQTVLQESPEEAILSYTYYDSFGSGILQTDQPNEQQLWSAEIRRIKEAVYRAKVALGKYFTENEDEKKDIIKFIDKTNSSRAFKIIELSKSIVKTLEFLSSSNVDKDINENIQFISQHIATEIVNDNLENLLLNNVVTSDLYDPTKIIKRENESVLFNLSDLRKWIKTYKENESN